MVSTCRFKLLGNRRTEVEDEEFVSTWQDQGGGTPAISNQLSKEQKQQLDDLLAKFKTVMSGKCG